MITLTNIRNWCGTGQKNCDINNLRLAGVPFRSRITKYDFVILLFLPCGEKVNTALFWDSSNSTTLDSIKGESNRVVGRYISAMGTQLMTIVLSA